MNDLVGLTLAVCLFLVAIDVASSAGANQVALKVLNLSGKLIDVYWIDTFKTTPELVAQTKKPLRNNTDSKINSFGGHKFSVRLHDHIPGSDANFTKGDEEETFRVYFDEDEGKLVLEKRNTFNEAMSLIEEAATSCLNLPEDEIEKCVSDAVMKEVIHLSESKKTMETFRDQMSNKLRNYTCADVNMEVSEPIRSYGYYHLGNEYNVDVLLDLDASKIWIVDDFVTPDECEMIVEAARPNLKRATVADSDGNSIVSENRKAQQAGYEFRGGSARSDPLWPLYDRILKLVNHHSHYNLLPQGQEGFTIIQYNVGDEYSPHCDGACEGEPYNKFGRVATSVLYCKVPEVGGGTSFSRADIFVKPKAGSALFFSYKGGNGLMDEGFTEHSGCPVVKGEKWIAAAWMREFVTEEDNWTRYDPVGVPILEDYTDESDFSDNESDSETMEQETEFYEDEHDEL